MQEILYAICITLLTIFILWVLCCRSNKKQKTSDTSNPKGKFTVKKAKKKFDKASVEERIRRRKNVLY